MASTSLLAHSRRKWRADGYFLEAAEHVKRLGMIVTRHDLFGFADLVAIKRGEIVFLQVTSWSNVMSRVNKIACEKHGLGKYKRPIREIAKDLLSVPGVRIIVEGWKKSSKTGLWESREVDVTPLLLNARRRKRCPEETERQ